MMLMSSVISNAQTQKKEAPEANQIEAYYFHPLYNLQNC